MVHDAGFGAAEFLALDEAGADSDRYGWGSEEGHDSHSIIEETTRRKMGASLTSGTNWSNANLVTIQPDDRAAAKRTGLYLGASGCGHVSLRTAAAGGNKNAQRPYSGADRGGGRQTNLCRRKTGGSG